MSVNGQGIVRAKVGCRTERSGLDGGVWIVAVTTGPITCQVVHFTFYDGWLWPRHATPFVSPGRPGGPSGNLPSPIADLCRYPSQFARAHTQFPLTRGHKSHTQSRHPQSL